MEKKKTAAIIVGAGSGTRMGANKIFLNLLHKPTLAWTVDAFERSSEVSSIIVVLHESDLEAGNNLAKRENWKKLLRICAGGARRQDSVMNGLRCIGDDHDVVMIHDAARPCITPGMIERGRAAVMKNGAAIAAVPIVDTLKRVNADLEITEAVPRKDVWAMQTPQVFDYKLIMRAHNEVKHDVTDDASMVEAIGARPIVFLGESTNIKITFPIDVMLAEMFLRSKIRFQQPK